MTLHFTQIFFTDARTFIVTALLCASIPCAASKPLFVPVHNSPAIQIIRAKLHRHAIARQDADEVLAHPARDMGQDLVVVLELHLEHSVGQRLGDRCHDLNRVFLRQTVSTSAGRYSRYRLVKLSSYSVKTFAPVAVTATVCSK